MATRRYQEEEEEVNAKLHKHSSSDSEVEDENWDDWKADEDPTDGSNPQLLCLFCASHFNSAPSLFQHCVSAHSFDFHGIKKSFSLDFYQCFKLINFVRSQVAANKCWSCGKACESSEELKNHLHETFNFSNFSKEGILPWDDDRYLNPFLEEDALLYSFDEDDENGYEDEDAMSVDSKELAMHLSQFELIKIDEEESSSGFQSEVTETCKNGVSDVKFAHTKTTETSRLDGVSDVIDGIPSLKNLKSENSSISSLKISKDMIKTVNKNYFGSYSSFGIHRDMIADKVRTDAYMQAIVENPSLLRGAVVMDVGCGTGILSLFAAQAGASRVIAVEASDKMAAIATQIAKDNGLLQTGVPGEGKGVIQVVQGMIEQLGNADHIQPHSVDVLISEWMGYCLLYESMLSSVLFARDRWLKPGGAILPNTATMFVAGFGRGGTSIPFWEDVYGFNMSCIGREVVEDAARIPIVDVIDSSNIVTTTEILQSFDLETMQPKQMDFTAEIELEPKLDSSPNHPSGSKSETIQCYGVVLWFDTGFTGRFCREKPVVLSTSPYGPSTHWSQTILTFREPIAMGSNVDGNKLATIGTDDCPAVRIHSRISVVRAIQHRSIDISLEVTGIGPDERKRNWPGQIFNLN